MSTFDVDGRALHYLAAGSGPPLVFVHGSGGCAGQWKHHCRHFSATHRVMAYDLIGCGANQPLAISSTFSYQDDAAALIAAIEHIGAPADVVTHSAGGIGAILAALDRPAAIRSLTLFEPVLFSLLSDRHRPAIEALRDLASSYRLLHQADGPGAAMGLFVDFWNGPGSWQRLPGPVQQSMAAGAGRLYLEWGVFLSGASPLRAADLARLSPPVLYFCGERTIEPMRQVTEIVLAQVPNGRLVSVPGAGHMSPFTHAAQVVADIERHLGAPLAAPAGSRPARPA